MNERVTDAQLKMLIAHYARFPPQNYELTGPVLSALRELAEARAKIARLTAALGEKET